MQWVLWKRLGSFSLLPGRLRVLPPLREVAERPQPEWRLLLLPLGVVAERPQSWLKRFPLEFHLLMRVAEWSQLCPAGRP